MSSSAPPELPWLIAASVWIESSIVKPFGAVCCRCRALTMPHVTVFWSPNGLPIAIAPSPTWTPLGVRERERVELRRRGAHAASTARSVEASLPTSVPLAVEPSAKRTVIAVAPSTTCWSVTMSPFMS